MPQPLKTTRDREELPIDPASRINALHPPASLTAIGEAILPSKYFVTTGEVIMKTRQLIKDIEAQYNNLLTYPPTEETTAHGKAVTVALGQAREFLADMIKLRGDWVWLETDQTGGGLVCRRKTPRTVPRPRVKNSHRAYSSQ